MKIALLGFAREGQSAYEYWNRDGNEITICDADENKVVPEGAVSRLGEDYLQNLDDFELLVRTPALHPRDILAANGNNSAILDKVTSVTNEFLRMCPTKHIIGVTGTKGKGTTTTLITRLLEASGKQVHLGGNIGLPALELLKENITSNDWVVLELSSFQLIDLKYSPPTAMCLLLEPEHLNWHTDMAEYLRAKSQLFVHQQADDRAIYYAKSEDSHHIASQSPGVLTPYLQLPGAIVEDDMFVIDGQQICGVSEVKLLGKHNWQNICAAITATWPVIQDVATIREVVTNFVGLPHRIELVRTLDGVSYYNDSFSTGLPATVAAVRAVTGPKVLILGGFNRNLDLTKSVAELAESKDELHKIMIIGEVAEIVAAKLREKGLTQLKMCSAKTMPEIIAAARALARKGDSIVFSPGFASYDMFNNFEERGDLFRQAVNDL